MMWNSADIIGYETIKTLSETLYIRKKKLKTVIWERERERVEVKIFFKKKCLGLNQRSFKVPYSSM